MSAMKEIIKNKYQTMLLRDYLRTAIKNAGFSHSDISKMPTGTKVALHVTELFVIV